MKTSWQGIALKIAVVAIAVGLDQTGHLSGASLQLVLILLASLGVSTAIATWHGAAAASLPKPKPASEIIDLVSKLVPIYRQMFPLVSKLVPIYRQMFPTAEPLDLSALESTTNIPVAPPTASPPTASPATSAPPKPAGAS